LWSMDELAQRLREARSGGALSLEAASSAATISPAYLHKLERGRVKTPSPHVLRRLAQVLGVQYLTLMELAGYLDREAGGDAPREDGFSAARKEDTVNSPVATGAPTNAEIVRLLAAVRSELAELRRQQDELSQGLRKGAVEQKT
jgi:transcriptional regulator with XRE-family HTH domain